MSCWVVPAIAAELWGVSIDHVLAAVRDGSLTTRRDHGFLFVDVAPSSDTYHRPRRHDEPAPLTFVPVSREPVAEAVSEPPPPADDPAPFSGILEPVPPAESEAQAPALGRDGDEELPPLDEEEDDTPLPPRRAVRSAVSRLRKPPPRLSKAA